MKKSKGEEKNTGKPIFKVTREFGLQELIDIYSDYAAKKIRDSLRVGHNEKDTDKKD